MIKNLKPLDVAEAARIHLEGMPDDFLPSFGIQFLTCLYTSIIKSKSAISLGYYKNDQLVAVIIGTTNTPVFMNGILRESWIKLLPFVIKSLIIKPFIIKSLIQTFFYGQNDSNNIPAELIVLSVDKNNRRRGIGKKLVSKLREEYIHRGIKRYKVGTLSNNIIANKFYKKVGGKYVYSFTIYNRIWNVYEYHIKKYRPSLSVILPTYNERKNLISLVPQIQAITKNIVYPLQIIIVDDNSPDGTGKAIKPVNKNGLNIKIYVRKNERGLASAIKFGIDHASGEKLLIMDTDLNHDPKEIPKLISESIDHDLVIGSRYVPGGGMENKLRQHLSYFFNLYIQLALGYSIHDNLSGYFIVDSRVLKKVNANQIFYGFGDYFIRLIFKLHKIGGKITEIPVFYKNRTYGVSKSRFIPMFINYTKTALSLRFSN